jgi:dynein heavy chain
VHSRIQAKTEKLEKSKALRQAQQEVALLVNMVRLADYMCCEGALSLLLRTLEGLRDTFESKAILLTQLSFDLDSPSLTEAAAAAAAAPQSGGDSGAASSGEGGMGQVTFHASEEEVRQALTVDLVDALNEVIKTLPRLPQQESLKPLFVAEAAASAGGAAGGHHGLDRHHSGHHGGHHGGVLHGGGGSAGSVHPILVRVGPEMTTMLMGYRPLQKAR